MIVLKVGICELALMHCQWLLLKKKLREIVINGALKTQKHFDIDTLM
jgi:hypothetical protein